MTQRNKPMIMSGVYDMIYIYPQACPSWFAVNGFGEVIRVLEF